MTFPKGTWRPRDRAYENFRICFRYLISEVYRWDRESFLKNVRTSFVIEHKLGEALTAFDKSLYQAVVYAFPEWSIHPWELSSVPNGFWRDPANIRRALDWLFRERLQWSPADVLVRCIPATLRRHRLSGLLNTYGGDLVKVLSIAYPDRDWSSLRSHR